MRRNCKYSFNAIFLKTLLLNILLVICVTCLTVAVCWHSLLHVSRADQGRKVSHKCSISHIEYWTGEFGHLGMWCNGLVASE